MSVLYFLHVYRSEQPNIAVTVFEFSVVFLITHAWLAMKTLPDNWKCKWPACNITMVRILFVAVSLAIKQI